MKEGGKHLAQRAAGVSEINGKGRKISDATPPKRGKKGRKRMWFHTPAQAQPRKRLSATAI